MSPKKKVTQKTAAAKSKTAKKPVEKRAKKSEVNARKTAAKTQVRMTREKVRSAKQATTKKVASKEGSRLKEKVVGHAPHSARITDPKGEVVRVASRTQFLGRSDENRHWLLIDAKNQIVGRLASEIAKILRGKHKASFTPNNDNGDFVVVINADKVRFTSTKETEKKYYKYSGYIGGLKTRTPEQLRTTYPERILEHAVKGMVPRNPLGRSQMKKLKIYGGESHPHVAQNPVLWSPKGSKTLEA